MIAEWMLRVSTALVALRAACCVLRAACCVLRAACNVVFVYICLNGSYSVLCTISELL